MPKRGGQTGRHRADRKRFPYEPRLVGGKIMMPAAAETHPVIAIPRGRYLGKRLGNPPKDEAEHFIRCPACGGWIDCRDLGQVFEHAGPLPHPAQDQAQ